MATDPAALLGALPPLMAPSSLPLSSSSLPSSSMATAAPLPSFPARPNSAASQVASLAPPAAESPAQNILDPPTTSDGCEPFVGPPPHSTSSFYRPATIADASLAAWLRSLGADLSHLYGIPAPGSAHNPSQNAASGASSSSSVILAALPNGYRLYLHFSETKTSRVRRLVDKSSSDLTPVQPDPPGTRPPDTSIDGVSYYIDPYVFGHPSGFKFRLPKEFTPHLLWLAVGALAPQNPLDYRACKCPHCPKYTRQCKQLYLHFTRPTLLQNDNSGARHVETGPSAVFRRGETVWAPITFDDQGRPRSAVALHEHILWARTANSSKDHFSSGTPGTSTATKRAHYGPPSRFLFTIGIPNSAFGHSHSQSQSQPIPQSQPQQQQQQQQNSQQRQLAASWQMRLFTPMRVHHSSASNANTLSDMINASGLNGVTQDEIERMVKRILYIPATVVERFAIEVPVYKRAPVKDNQPPQPPKEANPMIIVAYKLNIASLKLDIVATNTTISPYLARPAMPPPKSLTPNQQDLITTTFNKVNSVTSSFTPFGQYTNSFNALDFVKRLEFTFDIKLPQPTSELTSVTEYAGMRFGSEVFRVGDVVRLKGSFDSKTGDIIPHTKVAPNKNHSENLVCMIVMHILDVSNFVPRDKLPSGIVIGGKIYARQSRFVVTMPDFRTTMDAWFPAFKTQDSGRSKVPPLYPLSAIAGRFYMIRSATVRPVERCHVAATHLHEWKNVDGNSPLSFMPITSDNRVTLSTNAGGGIPEFGLDDSDMLGDAAVSTVNMPELKNPALGVGSVASKSLSSSSPSPASAAHHTKNMTLVTLTSSPSPRRGMGISRPTTATPPPSSASGPSRKHRRSVVESEGDDDDDDEEGSDAEGPPTNKRNRRDSTSSQESERLSVMFAQQGKRQRALANNAARLASMSMEAGNGSSTASGTSASGNNGDAKAIRTRAQRKNLLRGQSASNGGLSQYGRLGVKVTEPLSTVLSRLFQNAMPSPVPVVSDADMPPRTTIHLAQHHILRRTLLFLMHHPLAFLFLPGTNTSWVADSIKQQLSSYYTRGRGGANNTSLNAYIEPKHLWTIERTLGATVFQCNYTTSTEFAMDVQAMVTALVTFCSQRHYRGVADLARAFSQAWSDHWNGRVTLLQRVCDIEGIVATSKTSDARLDVIQSVMNEVVSVAGEVRGVVEEAVRKAKSDDNATSHRVDAAPVSSAPVSASSSTALVQAQRQPDSSTASTQSVVDAMYTRMERPLSQVVNALKDLKASISETSDQMSQQVLLMMFGAESMLDGSRATSSASPAMTASSSSASGSAAAPTPLPTKSGSVSIPTTNHNAGRVQHQQNKKPVGQMSGGPPRPMSTAAPPPTASAAASAAVAARDALEDSNGDLTMPLYFDQPESEPTKGGSKMPKPTRTPIPASTFASSSSQSSASKVPSRGLGNVAGMMATAKVPVIEKPAFVKIHRLPALQRLASPVSSTAAAAPSSRSSSTVSLATPLGSNVASQQPQQGALPTLEFLQRQQMRGTTTNVVSVLPELLSTTEFGGGDVHGRVTSTVAGSPLLPRSQQSSVMDLDEISQPDASHGVSKSQSTGRESVGTSLSVDKGVRGMVGTTLTTPAVASSATQAAPPNQGKTVTNTVAKVPKPTTDFTIKWTDSEAKLTKSVTAILTVFYSKNGQLIRYTESTTEFLKRMTLQSPLTINTFVSRGLTDLTTRELITRNSLNGPNADGSTTGPIVLKFSIRKSTSSTPNPVCPPNYEPLRSKLQLQAGVFATDKFTGIVFATHKDIMMVMIERGVVEVLDVYPTLRSVV